MPLDQEITLAVFFAGWFSVIGWGLRRDIKRIRKFKNLPKERDLSG